jgi:hypothetical protein
MPRKVLRSAHTLGVHNDCLVGSDPCARCAHKINLAFDHHYGHCANETEMLGEIIADFAIESMEDNAA